MFKIEPLYLSLVFPEQLSHLRLSVSEALDDTSADVVNAVIGQCGIRHSLVMLLLKAHLRRSHAVDSFVVSSSNRIRES